MILLLSPHRDLVILCARVISLAMLNIPHLRSFPDFISVFGYFGIFLFFVTVDQLTFVPEEITLLSLGYLSAHGVFNPFVAGLASLLSFVIVDVTYFYLSRKGRKFASRLRSRARGGVNRLGEKLQANFPKTLLVLCFIPRMRMWAPIISGSMNIPLRKFLIYDTLGLVLFTSVYITLGMVFHSGLQSVLSEVELLQHSAFVVILIVAGIAIYLVARRQRISAK